LSLFLAFLLILFSLHFFLYYLFYWLFFFFLLLHFKIKHLRIILLLRHYILEMKLQSRFYFGNNEPLRLFLCVLLIWVAKQIVQALFCLVDVHHLYILEEDFPLLIRHLAIIEEGFHARNRFDSGCCNKKLFIENLSALHLCLQL